jgi:3-oxoacyl-[acyl-carrier-protein] synthase II
MKRRAVITGIGLLTPLGNDADKFFNNALRGTNCIHQISKFNASSFPVRIGAEIKWTEAEQAELGELDAMPTVAKWSVLAARKAIRNAGLDLSKIDPHSIDVVLGASISSLEGIEHRYLDENGCGMKDAPGTAVVYASPSASAIQVSRYLGVYGEVANITTACSSTTNAIGYAVRLIQHGESTCVITGGAEESLCPLFLGALGNGSHLSRRNDQPQLASRPFDRQRDGYVLSDAAGVFILEEYEHALARGADIYCEIAGVGGSSDATTPFKFSKSEEPSARALEKALKSGGRTAADVDYYCAVALSMQWMDVRETRMIKRVFQNNAYKVAISSIKSMMGHSLGASGAIQAATCAMAIRRGAVPPTTNFEEPDIECDLNYVANEAREMKVRNALLYTIGNGGTNASLLLTAC